MEQSSYPNSEKYIKLLTFEPKPITYFVPTDAAKQKEAFLSGEIENPDHAYGKLMELDFPTLQHSITTLGTDILTDPDLSSKHLPSYEEFVEGYGKKTRFLELARAYKMSEDHAQKQQIKEEFMNFNIELYGEPDEVTYRSLLSEKLHHIKTKQLDAFSSMIRAELLDLIPDESSAETIERFRPSHETVEWMHSVAMSLYGSMLSHVPDGQSSFSPQETQQIFEEIIREEFGESASEWRVDIEPAQTINVKSTEKRIVIPVDCGELTTKLLRQLIVHEIGVHMLRAVSGELSNLEPMQNGLNGYYDSEEGLGKVMEQALEGKFAEAGVDHYITAGLAHFDGMDFRKTFEVKWRLALLAKISEDEKVTDKAVHKIKDAAYKATMRIFRGTDELPWFKDLAYYNGTIGMWRHLEEIRGDYIRFSFVLLGKANPADIAHQRIMLETKTL